MTRSTEWVGAAAHQGPDQPVKGQNVPEEPRLHAFILAAGLGSRLWPLTKHTPKALLDLGDGTTLLDRHLELFRSCGAVDGVTIVTGHLAGKIEQRIAEGWAPSATTRYNPFYADHGPLGSLWTIRAELRETDFLLLNGDTLYRRDVIDAATRTGQPTGVALAVSTTATPASDDVRARVDGHRITGVGKGLDGTSHRSAGLLVVRGEQERARFLSSLDELVRDPRNLASDSPWHDLVNHLIASGTPVDALLVDDAEWTEVDLHPDIGTLQQMLAGKLVD
jgi:L-glutamine-phosphate cytidylyltransferase